MVKIGNVKLDSKPRIVAVIDEFVPVAQIVELKQGGVDFLEMRVDCFKEPLGEIITYLKDVRKSVELPSIGTVRETESNCDIRLDVFKEIIPLVDCIDIELDNSLSARVRSLCVGKTVMVSEHDFEKTPSVEGLNDMVKRALDQGAAIVKIAVMANTTDDVRRLLHFTEECKTPLVTIAMGPLGTVSRVIAPLFGSLFTYGYLNKAVAPGQLSVKQLLDEVALFYPNR
jgi:3-dehydroquinate dehydratase-1